MAEKLLEEGDNFFHFTCGLLAWTDTGIYDILELMIMGLLAF